MRKEEALSLLFVLSVSFPRRTLDESRTLLFVPDIEFNVCNGDCAVLRICSEITTRSGEEEDVSYGFKSSALVVL
jgi:hypothetical protein